MHNRLIIDSLSSQLAILDKDGVIIQTNKAWDDSMEQAKLDIHSAGVGVNYLDVVEHGAKSNKDIREIYEGLRDVLKGAIEEFELDYSCHNNENRRWFTLRATPLKSKSGTVIMHTEVTPRCLAEEDLRRSEDRLKLATSNARIGIWDWDVPNNILIWEESMYELYGVEEDDFTGAYDAWEKTLHPDDKELAAKEVDLALQGKKKFNTVFRIQINDSIRYIHAKAEVEFDNDGQATRMTGANMDVTGEKQSELLLKRTKERLQEVIHHANVGIIYANSRVEVIGCNKKFVEILEYDKESEIVGMTIDMFTHPEDIGKDLEQVERIMNNEIDNFDMEKRYLTKSGDVKWVQMFVSVVRDSATSEPLQFVAMVNDITDKKNLEREKLRLMYLAEEKERNRISHDLHDGLGQSIAAASLYINALEPLALEQLNSEAKEIFNTCKKLVKNSVEETRLVSHNFMPRTLGQFGLEKTIESVMNNYQRIKTAMTFKFESNLNSTRFNHELELSVFRIVQELINNAIKHSKAGVISVKMNLLERSLVVVVSDDGVGLAEDGGCENGIGLRNVKERMEYLGGKMEFNAKNEKGGVSVTLSVKY